MHILILEATIVYDQFMDIVGLNKLELSPLFGVLLNFQVLVFNFDVFPLLWDYFLIFLSVVFEIK